MVRVERDSSVLHHTNLATHGRRDALALFVPAANVFPVDGCKQVRSNPQRRYLSDDRRGFFSKLNNRSRQSCMHVGTLLQDPHMLRGALWSVLTGVFPGSEDVRTCGGEMWRV